MYKEAIRLKDTPDQQKIFLALIKGDEEAKAVIDIFATELYKQIHKKYDLNNWYCDWLPVDSFDFTVKLEIPVKIIKK